MWLQQQPRWTSHRALGRRRSGAARTASLAPVLSRGARASAFPMLPQRRVPVRKRRRSVALARKLRCDCHTECVCLRDTCVRACVRACVCVRDTVTLCMCVQ
jgi:hypothetical protein